MTKELREEYAKLNKECADLLTKCGTEKRQQNAEEKASQEARFARMDVLKAQAEEEQKLAGYAFASGETASKTPGKSQAQLEFERSQGIADDDDCEFNRKMTPDELRKYKKHANRFLRTGEVSDKFAITTTGNSILVPTSVMPPEAIRRNMNALRALIAATGYTPLETTSTETFVLPIFDDTANTGDTPAEGATSATVVALPISSTSFVDFDSKFCIHSRLTDVQKDQQISDLKGHRVRWEGIVSYVSDDSVEFKHKATTATYAVLLRVLSKERSGLTSLNNGDLVTYEGTITDYGTILPHGLRDGHIVSTKPISSGDQLIFLANTGTAVMERIAGKADEP